METPLSSRQQPTREGSREKNEDEFQTTLEIATIWRSVTPSVALLRGQLQLQTQHCGLKLKSWLSFETIHIFQLFLCVLSQRLPENILQQKTKHATHLLHSTFPVIITENKQVCILHYWQLGKFLITVDLRPERELPQLPPTCS